MFEWFIELVMRGGQIIDGIYKTNQIKSLDAAKELLPNAYQGRFSYIYSTDRKSQIIFRVDDVSAIKISMCEEEDNEQMD